LDQQRDVGLDNTSRFVQGLSIHQQGIG